MTRQEITRQLEAWSRGDRSALDELLPFMVANMRAIARRLPKRGDTLNTTALVNETWLKLSGAGFELADREHFFSLVARAMRQILIDHARGQQRLKRGAGAASVTLAEDLGITHPQIEQTLLIDSLLDRLERENARRCRIFEMRFFAGFSVEEVSQALQVAENTVIRDYRLACAWLRFHCSPSQTSAGARV